MIKCFLLLLFVLSQSQCQEKLLTYNAHCAVDENTECDGSSCTTLNQGSIATLSDCIENCRTNNNCNFVSYNKGNSGDCKSYDTCAAGKEDANRFGTTQTFNVCAVGAPATHSGTRAADEEPCKADLTDNVGNVHTNIVPFLIDGKYVFGAFNDDKWKMAITDIDGNNLGYHFIYRIPVLNAATIRDAWDGVRPSGSESTTLVTQVNNMQFCKGGAIRPIDKTTSVFGPGYNAVATGAAPGAGAGAGAGAGTGGGLSACPESLGNPLAEECLCMGQTTPCAIGKFCYENSCHDDARCTVRSNIQKNIFYGAKVYGSWNQSTKVMSMNFTTPYDVKLNSIVWKGAATQDLKFDHAAYGMWKKNVDNPCQPVYQLAVPQTTFFGSGSKFNIKGSQLSSNLRVDASEVVTTVKNGETYTYTRSIKNTVPVLVNLVTKTTIKVRFRSTVAPPGEKLPAMEDFVLFIAAEDNFADEEKNVVITMQVHSRACVDHTRADKGVVVSGGLDNIAEGKASEFVWVTNPDGTKKQSFEHNLCVEELVWTFYPKKYKENTYEIDLKFTSRGTAETFTTTAAIDIKQADVLADVGFTSTITPYEDEDCTVQQSKFKLGQKFYTKIQLTDLIVPTTNITCNTYKIKQTKDGNEEVTDLKEEAKYAFMEKKITGDAHICGAELESHHFHISVDGYDTVLETEILIDYDQTNQRRKLVRIPLTRDMLYEAGYFNDEFAVGSSSQLSEEDLAFQNTKRAPDEDDMTVNLFIDPEEKSVAFSVSEETMSSVKILTVIGLFIGAAGFTFGYFSKKYKGGDYVSLIEMQG